MHFPLYIHNRRKKFTYIKFLFILFYIKQFLFQFLIIKKSNMIDLHQLDSCNLCNDHFCGYTLTETKKKSRKHQNHTLKYKHAKMFKSTYLHKQKFPPLSLSQDISYIIIQCCFVFGTNVDDFIVVSRFCQVKVWFCVFFGLSSLLFKLKVSRV